MKNQKRYQKVKRVIRIDGTLTNVYWYKKMPVVKKELNKAPFLVAIAGFMIGMVGTVEITENTIRAYDNQVIAEKAQNEAFKQEIEVILEATKEAEVKSEPVIEENDWITGEATAYTCDTTMTESQKAMNCPNDITANGSKPQANHTLACDKSLLNKTIEIKDKGLFKCEDRGGAIKGNKIDIFMQTYQEAIQFGRQKIEYRIVDMVK